ncbi:MAG: hypothetical protein QM811_28975 [Pirellulales bacterium]
MQSEFNRVDAELKAAESTLPEEIRDVYQRIVASKGADALAAVDNGSCGGCFQSQTANMLADLAQGKTVFCRSCGRLLYLPEDRGRSLNKH